MRKVARVRPSKVKESALIKRDDESLEAWISRLQQSKIGRDRLKVILSDPNFYEKQKKTGE